MPTANTLYKNIFEQIIAIELCKKELSKKILLLKEGKKRFNYIYSFLNYDLNKHELLEHATVVAMHNNELDTISKHILNFYSYNGEEELIEIIRKEIKTSRSLINVLRKQINDPKGLSFVEKRMLNEISKYVIEQARAYMHIKK